MREEDRDAVLKMAGSCFDAADSDEEAVSKLGRPMAAARRLLKNYEPGIYAEMFAEQEEEEVCACEMISEETADAESEKSVADRIYDEVFGLGEYKNKREDALAEEALSEKTPARETAPEEEDEEPIKTPAEEKSESASADGEEDRGETERIAKAVEERASGAKRAEKDKKAEKADGEPQYSVIKIIGYSIPAVAIGVPVAVVLVALSLVVLLIGAALAAAGGLIISFVFLNMVAVSDILMTAGAGLAAAALGILIILFSVYIFVKYGIGFINRVFEGGAKNCLKDKSEYRAPIVEEDSPGKRLLRTLSLALLYIMGLGVLSFLFSMILGADIKRIAAVVFAKYDLVAVIRYLTERYDGLRILIFR